jgi:cytochrome c
MRSLRCTFRIYLSSLASIAFLAGANLIGKEALPDSSHFRKVVLATNLLEPIQLSISKRGDVYFAERHGAVKVWKPETQQTTMVGQLNVFTGPEDGLLGLVLNPGFETNHWLYLFHSTVGILENRVSRFTVRNDSLDLTSQKILLHIPTLAKKPNHSGGGLGFDAAGNL